jgi:hypothetical protein
VALVASRSKPADKKIQTEVGELKDLLVRYAKQETVEPLKGLVRFLGMGLLGSVLFSAGAVLLGLGIIRVLQEETWPHLSGNLSWVPYVAAVIFAVGIAVACGLAIGREQRKVERERVALGKERG